MYPIMNLYSCSQLEYNLSMLNIDFYRKKNGWTLEELANKVGTTRGNLQKIKRKDAISSEWIKKLALVFKIYPSELLPKEWQKPASEFDADLLEQALIESDKILEIANKRIDDPKEKAALVKEVYLYLLNEKQRNNNHKLSDGERGLILRLVK